MTQYDLRHHAGGTIELPSGPWRWFVIRLISLPENECTHQQLIFANEDVRGDIMRVDVPPTLDNLDDANLRQFGLHPDERTFPTPNGQATLRPPDPQRSD